MKVDADSFEEYFAAAGERGEALRELDKAIREAAPHLEPVLFRSGMMGSALGYGMQPYQTKSMKEPGEWPLVILANQKNYMAVYLCAVNDEGEYIAEKNAEKLGKVSVGRSCIRFKKLEDLDLEALKDILRDIDDRFVRGEKIFGI